MACLSSASASAKVCSAPAGDRRARAAPGCCRALERDGLPDRPSTAALLLVPRAHQPLAELHPQERRLRVEPGRLAEVGDRLGELAVPRLGPARWRSGRRPSAVRSHRARAAGPLRRGRGFPGGSRWPAPTVAAQPASADRGRQARQHEEGLPSQPAGAHGARRPEHHASCLSVGWAHGPLRHPRASRSLVSSRSRVAASAGSLRCRARLSAGSRPARRGRRRGGVGARAAFARARRHPRRA